MAAIPARAAAYTRTGILKRFLDHLSESPPARVDPAYVAQRLELKGGDVRAFLQSVRVLGFVDALGGITERGRRTRGLSQRSAAVREALSEAYPELVHRWQLDGVMTRQEVEDFFKVDYGLSTSSAGPAAKLFMDLVQEYGPFPALPQHAAIPTRTAVSPAVSTTPNVSAAPTPSSQLPAPTLQTDVRLAALEAVKSSLKIEVTAEWDRERIELVFDRMERLMDRIVGGG